jgi:hypothetical protein
MTGSINSSPIEKLEPLLVRKKDTSKVSCMLFMPTSRSGWSRSIASAIFSECESRQIVLDFLQIELSPWQVVAWPMQYQCAHANLC